jgi:hypothetical protein
MRGSARRERSRTLSGLLAVLVLSILLAGCAATSTTILDEEVVTNQKHMASYKSLIIRDFELKRELYTDGPAEKMSERELRYARIPALLAENIERYVKARQNYRNVSRNGQPSAFPSSVRCMTARVIRRWHSFARHSGMSSTQPRLSICSPARWQILLTASNTNSGETDVHCHPGRRIRHPLLAAFPCGPPETAHFHHRRPDHASAYR